MRLGVGRYPFRRNEARPFAIVSHILRLISDLCPLGVLCFTGLRRRAASACERRRSSCKEGSDTPFCLAVVCERAGRKQFRLTPRGVWL